MKQNKETWAVLADLHWDYVNKKALETTNKILKDLKPDVVVFLGDCCDYEGISKYTMKDYGDGVDSCEEELISFKEGFNEICKSAGNPRTMFCMGNHDGQRVEKLLSKLKAKHKNREYKDVKKALDFREHFKDSKIVDYNDYIKKGSLIFTHGEFHNDNHSKTHALRYGTDVLYGHLHTFQSCTLPLKAKNKAIQAISMPCLCELNPTYRNNRSSSWVNGMAVVTFLDNNHFIDIIQYKNNKTFYNGKQY